MPQPPYAIIPTTSHRRPRYHLLFAGLVLAAAGVTAGVLLRPAGTLPQPGVVESITTTSAARGAQTPAQTAAQTAAQTPVQTPAQTPAQTVMSEAAPSPATRGAATTPLLTRPAAVCITCGTVETVRAAQRQVESQGVGAVPGAAGMHEVRVRMDDGTLRSFSSATQPQPGAAVRLQGDSYRVVQPPSQDGRANGGP